MSETVAQINALRKNIASYLIAGDMGIIKSRLIPPGVSHFVLGSYLPPDLAAFYEQLVPHSPITKYTFDPKTPYIVIDADKNNLVTRSAYPNEIFHTLYTREPNEDAKKYEARGRPDVEGVYFTNTVIGEGGYARVEEAFKIEPGGAKRLAIKYLKYHPDRNPEMVAVLENEYKTLGELHAIGWTQQNPYFTVPYALPGQERNLTNGVLMTSVVEGSDMVKTLDSLYSIYDSNDDTYLNRRHRTLGFSQILQFIADLHDIGVAIGDLKSDNVLLHITNKTWLLGVVDFGQSIIKTTYGKDNTWDFDESRNRDLMRLADIGAAIILGNRWDGLKTAKVPLQIDKYHDIVFAALKKANTPSLMINFLQTLSGPKHITPLKDLVGNPYTGKSVYAKALDEYCGYTP